MASRNAGRVGSVGRKINPDAGRTPSTIPTDARRPILRRAREPHDAHPPGPAHHPLDLQAAAAAIDEPFAPIEDRGASAVAGRELGWITLSRGQQCRPVSDLARSVLLGFYGSRYLSAPFWQYLEALTAQIVLPVPAPVLPRVLRQR